MKFPSDFIWGAAAASYQVEGAAFEDGKGPSVWDMLCRKEGAIWLGQNGDVASDHYHHYQEDVALMASFGIQAYRLSISWPRVLPDGTGLPNPAGLDFYDRLIDASVGRSRHALRHPFSLGLSLCTLLPGRLAEPRQPGLVCRLCQPGGAPPGRPGRGLDDPQ